LLTEEEKALAHQMLPDESRSIHIRFRIRLGNFEHHFGKNHELKHLVLYIRIMGIRTEEVNALTSWPKTNVSSSRGVASLLI